MPPRKRPSSPRSIARMCRECMPLSIPPPSAPGCTSPSSCSSSPTAASRRRRAMHGSTACPTPNRVPKDSRRPRSAATSKSWTATAMPRSRACICSGTANRFSPTTSRSTSSRTDGSWWARHSCGSSGGAHVAGSSKPFAAATVPSRINEGASMIRSLAILIALAGFAAPLPAQELVRIVRLKISAGDLATGQAAAEDHKRAKGVDAEYLSAVGWIARGAEMLGRLEIADETLRELRRAIPAETAEHLSAYGAAIEVEGRLIHRREGRGAALRYFEQQLAKAQAPSLRSRIRKNMNMLSLEGQPAPPLGGTALTGSAAPTLASLRGKPVVLFFFAEWCGDCKAQAPSLERVWQKYRDRVPMIAVTRLYSTPTDEKPMTP